MDQIITLIGQYAFPIVMCLIMAWYVKDQSDEHRKEVKELNEQHNKETDKLSETITNNTLALQKLVDIMEDFKRG